MSSIIQFPSTLRADVDKGGHHCSFEIIGKATDTDVHKIHLFVPQGFSLGDGASYGTLNLGVIKGIEELTKKSDTNKTADQKEMEGIGIGATLMKSLGIDQVGAADKALLDKGVALNNQTTATFDGMNIRTYSMEFSLVASSAEEAKTAQVIEHTFRKYMYPKLINQAFIEYPPKFRIKFMTGKERNNHMPLLLDSYLVGLTVSYNNNANMFHTDGSPTDLTVALEFQEERQMTRGDLYDLEDVAPAMIKQRFTTPETSSDAEVGG